jgi:hypothetical protein
MDRAELQRILDTHGFFDEAIMFHAFTEYMRDYEVLVDVRAEKRRYLFRHCVSANVASTLPPHTWSKSLDDALLSQDPAHSHDAFQWWVKWQCVYPGVSIVTDSAEAARWTEALGLDFHEVRIETNVHDITLVFAELDVSVIDSGYRPFEAGVN